jgi:predicted RNA methylase
VATRSELGQFIPLHYHHSMLADESRMDAFGRAISYAVRPGASVVELGGGTGVLSFLAARAGAVRVRCVELNPELADTARALLTRNGCDGVVEVVDDDATLYVPPEPVDVVVCEQLHVGMLREQQIDVIRAFKRNYLEAHGGPLPRFLPEAFVQAVQPVEQSSSFHGYDAPFAHLQDSMLPQPRTRELGVPRVFQTVAYSDELPDTIQWHGEVGVEHAGRLNALRFVTKHVVAIVAEERRTIDWFSSYLIVPLPAPLDVGAGETVSVSFGYRPGAHLAELAPLVHRS